MESAVEDWGERHELEQEERLRGLKMMSDVRGEQDIEQSVRGCIVVVFESLNVRQDFLLKSTQFLTF